MHYPASRSLSAASSLPRGKRIPVSLTGLASMILPGIISRTLQGTLPEQTPPGITAPLLRAHIRYRSA